MFIIRDYSFHVMFGGGLGGPGLSTVYHSRRIRPTPLKTPRGRLTMRARATRDARAIKTRARKMREIRPTARTWSMYSSDAALTMKLELK